jgi:hypothetical protein
MPAVLARPAVAPTPVPARPVPVPTPVPCCTLRYQTPLLLLLLLPQSLLGEAPPGAMPQRYLLIVPSETYFLLFTAKGLESI